MGDPGPPKISNHDLISSYFIGPKSENLKPFSDNIAVILEQLRKTRDSYGQDEIFISDTARQKLGPVYKKFQEAVEKTAALLGEHSIPFWHPRYQGHMCTDMTMPGLLGYFMTMIYNPNNVAVEASPFTTVVELKVGQQLCEMFGYNIREEATHLPLSWGHITCDGTVANLESIWVARNLKFYPLTLYQAMKEGPLGFIANDFQVTTCVGEEKLFKDLGVWELLNLQPDVILDMGDALYRQFGVTSKFLEQALTPFTIQTTGKDVLEREFRITKPAKYFLAQTRHYSWPKGGGAYSPLSFENQWLTSIAIAGIGSANMQGVELDMEGRISLDALERELNRCLEERQAVYAVVAVIGTTEEGGVDRLHEILAMRRRFQDRGLSFLVHADAAWGGYFASMIPRKMMDPTKPSDDNDGNTAVDEVPSLALRQDTLTDMIALKEADTITVDPHKAGYIPYPAGSLCYRDGRMRFLVTWTSPYLTQGSTENIGVYGVEGSKPGAAAMAAWMSNQTIGLSPSGYGRLLGEAAFTSARLSAWYAAMHVDQPGWKEKRPYYIIIPFNPLPIEKDGKGTLSDEVNSRREWILKNVIEKSNDEISKEKEIMDWLRNIGSDLNINAFAINWYDEQGNLNTELEEANYLMRRVVNRLSITTTKGKPEKPSLFLTSTQFEPALYGQCAQNFMRRLGLAPCAQDLWVLRNVVMSPFPTTRDFITKLMKEELEKVIIEEVKHCRTRNSREQKELEFLLRGTDEVFLDFQTSFHRATQREQIILAANLESDTQEAYKALKNRFSAQDIVFKSKESQNLEELITKIKKEALKIDGVIGAREGDTFIGNPIQCTVEMTRVVISRPLNSANRDDHYPRHFMPFYLYGSEDQYHISHMLLQAPNVNLSASNVKLDKELLKKVRPRLRNHKALILTLTGYREETMHPFPPTNNDPVLLSKDFFFRPDKVLNVKVYEDPKADDAKGPGLIDNLGPPIARGTMTLRADVHVDVETLNRDPLETKEEGVRWDTKLDEIKDAFEEGRKMASGMAPQAAV